MPFTLETDLTLYWKVYDNETETLYDVNTSALLR